MARGRELVVPPLGPRSHTIKLARTRGCGYSVAVGTRYSGGGVNIVTVPPISGQLETMTQAYTLYIRTLRSKGVHTCTSWEQDVAQEDA